MPLDGSALPSREEIGGKAWSIARMRQLRLPVPPAVVLPVAACRTFQAEGLTDELWASACAGVAAIEEESGRTFGTGLHPLLLSVRSGAAVSMPGMMDTVLDLGMNDEVEKALAAESGDEAYARDTRERFLHAYRRVILRTEFDDPVPEDPWEQLRAAVKAVFASWDARRARAYRRHWGIPDDGGTAITLQAMVFGNLDDTSGTGVLFTRDPLSGRAEPYGEYLPRGQGEDVVSGERDPLPLTALDAGIRDQLVEAGRTLEREGRDAQDVEFTVERGRLYLLQTRTAKRAPLAAVRIAVDLVDEGLIEPDEALRRVTPDQVRTLLRPRIADDVRSAAEVLARGEPACPGIAQGVAVVDPDEAEQRTGAGEQVVLVRPTTSPEDVGGMMAADGICTEAGGSTSHAAVVSRALGRPCVVGCGAGSVTALAGRELTVDGASGEVFADLLPLQEVDADDEPALARLHAWASESTPVTVLPDGADLPQAVDLDEEGVVDPSDVARALRNAVAARGQVLATDEGLAAALAAGVRTVAVPQPLPALLAARRIGETA